MKFLLRPFSWLYAFIMVCRNKAFDLGILKIEDVGVPVISVGNMTMGGTGKTPLVEYVVQTCLARGRKVAVVSRGYGRSSSGMLVVSNGQGLCADATQGGDEPVQIAGKFPAAIVVVGEQRVEAARKAVMEFGTDVIILDDGFQHRYIKRSLDIVVLDSRKDLLRLPMIPAGERREPMSALARANLVAFSRTDEVPASCAWVNRMSNDLHGREVHYRYVLEKIQRVGSDVRLSPMDLKKTRLLLFSGIGDHAGFVRQMGKAGLEVVGDVQFPDHHPYTKPDMARIVEAITRKGADAALTTEKDLARLSGSGALISELMQRCPLYCAPITVEIVRGKQVLDSMIDKCLAGKIVS